MRPFVAGALVLAVAMGVGRFAYTPLLPLMRADAALSVSLAGVLASVNLAGYLLGAAIAMHPRWRAYRTPLLAFGTWLVVLLTAAMALGPSAWAAARFGTGVASGLAFVMTVSLMLDHAQHTRSPHGAALLFAGVGLGIAGGGALVSLFAPLGGSRVAWLGLAAVSLCIVAFALRALPYDRNAPQTESGAQQRRGDRRLFSVLAFTYGIEGAAYVIPATFLVALVRQTPAIARLADASWILVGIVAMPSVALWSAARGALGAEGALLVALLAQGLGMLAPFVLPGALGVITLALSLGVTFMGITSLSTSLGRELSSRESNVALGFLTVVYGIGQIAGPLVATSVSLRTGRYRDALVVAGVALLIAAFALAGAVWEGRGRERPRL